MPLLRVRVIDLETAGTAPHEVCEIGWQDVLQDEGGRWVVSKERGAKLADSILKCDL